MVEYKQEPDSVFRALGDPTRRRMIEQLAQRDLSIGELAEPFAMSLAGASKHVGVLEKAGLIIRKKKGRERICSLQPSALRSASDWIERYATFWNERLDALDKAIGEEGDE